MAELETIVAISTPLGEGGIGIVRLSGPAAVPIGRQVFSCTPPLGSRTRYVEFGTVLNQDNRPLDQGLAWVFRSPRSYTGEDTVEISCHGSVLVLESLVEASISCGARLAEPGEFTRQAFLNGRLDLLQAEAVIDLIQAGSIAAIHNAYGQAFGRLTVLVNDLKACIVSALSLIEVGLDFSEEDIRAIGRSEVRSELDRASKLTTRLLGTFEGARRRKSGFQIALLGNPNAGKSTLLNTLLGEDRAIITPIPGTTRDTVEGRIVWQGESVRLIDTAGIRSTNHPIEKQGIERSLLAAKEADLILFVLDGSKIWTQDDDYLLSLERDVPALVLINKIDLPFNLQIPSGFFDRFPILKVSAITGHGLDKIPPLAMSFINKPNLIDGVGLTRVRHHECLSLVLKHLQASLSLLDFDDQEECVAAELQDALLVFNELLGESVSDDVLDFIFSQFCIGK